MKKTAILLTALIAIAAFTASCYKADIRDPTNLGKNSWVFEGWSCPPMANKEKPPSSLKCKKKEFLYMKFSAAASTKAIDTGRLAQTMATCREAALLQVKGDGMTKIIGEYLEKASGVSDGQSTGVAIVASSRGRIKGVGLYDCCAINPDTGRCVKPDSKQNWEQCMCVGYMKFKGGQKSFDSLAEKVKAEN